MNQGPQLTAQDLAIDAAMRRLDAWIEEMEEGLAAGRRPIVTIDIAYLIARVDAVRRELNWARSRPSA